MIVRRELGGGVIIVLINPLTLLQKNEEIKALARFSERFLSTKEQIISWDNFNFLLFFFAQYCAAFN